VTGPERVDHVAPGTPLERPAVSLLHRDPPLRPSDFFFHRRIVFVATVFAVVALAVLASTDASSVLLRVDEPVARWVSDIRTDTWTDFFDGASRLGDNIVVFAIAAPLAVTTWFRCRHLAVAIVLAAAFRPLMEFILKAGIDRERPDIDPLGEFAGPSHPSGHPMAAAALWGLIPAVVALHVRSRVLWWTAVVATFTVVVLVAAARVYKGAHWITDVTASLLWAGLYLLAVQGVFDRFHHERDCRHPQHEMQAGR
jgi:membrane-associated phospholipid phosphatase